MSYRNYASVALCLLAAPWPLHGEPAKTAAATVRCRVFAIGKAPLGEVYVKNEGKYQPVAISTDYVTPSFRADAKEGIVFYRKAPAEGAKTGSEKKDKDEYLPFAKCVPAGGMTRQLVIMTPAGDSGWSATAKSDAETAFPAGSRLIFNLSNQTVGMDFGGTQLTLKPKQNGLLAAAKNAPEGYAPIRMVRPAATGDAILFFSSTWRQHDKARELVILYSTPGTSHGVSFASVPDAVEAKDEVELKSDSKTSSHPVK